MNGVVVRFRARAGKGKTVPLSRRLEGAVEYARGPVREDCVRQLAYVAPSVPKKYRIGTLLEVRRGAVR